MNDIIIEQNGKNTILQIDKENNISEIKVVFNNYKVEIMEIKFYKKNGSKGN